MRNWQWYYRGYVQPHSGVESARYVTMHALSSLHVFLIFFIIVTFHVILKQLWMGKNTEEVKCWQSLEIITQGLWLELQFSNHQLGKHNPL